MRIRNEEKLNKLLKVIEMTLQQFKENILTKLEDRQHTQQIIRLETKSCRISYRISIVNNI